MQSMMTADPQRIERRPLLRYLERRAPVLHRAYCDLPDMATPWEIPTVRGAVLCHEADEQPFRHASTTLGIPVDVQDIAWNDCLLGGSRLFVPQWLATGNAGGIASCEAGLDPLTSIDFDNSLSACQAMGAGWSLMTNAQHFVMAIISQAYWNGQSPAKEPTGNTSYGWSHSHNAETGIRQDAGTPGTNDGGTARTLTGLAADSTLQLNWSHDGSATGVFDLVGNVWEWRGRVRVNEGRIEIIPASAGIQPSQIAASTEWRAVRPDGTLVTTGAGGDMLHYDATAGIFLALARDGVGSSTSNTFKDLGAGAITPVPPVLVAHMLYPWSASVPTVGRFYVNTAGERLPIRGGSWNNGSDAGVAALLLSRARGDASAGVGFRPAFVI